MSAAGAPSGQPCSTVPTTKLMSSTIAGLQPAREWNHKLRLCCPAPYEPALGTTLQVSGPPEGVALSGCSPVPTRIWVWLACPAGLQPARRSVLRL